MVLSTFRRSLLIFFCFCCKFAVSSADVAAPACQNTDYGRSCFLNVPVEVLAMLEDRLMVGCSNSLFSLSLDLQVDIYVDLSPEQRTFNSCAGFDPGQLGNDPSQCNNFVKVIELVPSSSGEDDKIMVCGTNAFRPKCTLHRVANISTFEYMTEVHHIDEGFSPYSDDSQIIATLTSGRRFFSGTQFEVYASPETIGMAPNPLLRDNTFTVQVPTSDPRWLKQPTFISSYEIGNHIYFFLREPAYEINLGESVVYSRAIRICKDDNGTTTDPNDPSTNFFLTFQKARLICSSNSELGSIPYTYDNLQSTFLWTAPDGQQFIYGVFTSPTNGPSGSAICKYSFDPNSDGSLTKVFEDGEYLVSEGSPPTWSKRHASTFSCPGDPGNQRSSTDASQNQLVYNPVTAMEPEPLHTVLGKRLAKIAVDVVNYNGSSQTILYFSTAEGDIYQLVQGKEALIHRAGTPLSDLTVHKNADETRFLYATTENHIMSISQGDCSRYGDCFTCLDSKDAYCGWDSDTNACMNKILLDSTNLLQSALATESDTVRTCGKRSDVTTPTPLSCQSSTSPPGIEDTTENADNCTSSTGGVSPKSSSGVSIPDIIGAAVGAFVVGIPVGAFVCFIFLKLFVVPRRHKHTINQQRPSQGDTNTVTQVNNCLTNDDHQQIGKKELAMKENPSYIQQTPIAPPPVQPKPSPLTLAPPPPGNSNHKRTNSQDINRYESPENDEAFSDQDQVPPLRSISSASTHSYRGHRSNGNTCNQGVNGLHHKKIPGYRVRRGRTDSTTWLRANSESSEPASPMDSPISDV